MRDGWNGTTIVARVGHLSSIANFPATDWRAVGDALTVRGYAIIAGALPVACWSALREEAEDLMKGKAFAQGRIGHGSGIHPEARVRGDSLCWLDPRMRAGGAYLGWMNGLRLSLNRSLFLGLTAYEAHYAHFPVGAFYRSHLDRYGDSNARVLSSVLYCNRDWPAGVGGEFVMFDPHGDPCVTLAPEGGTLVLFLSAEARHEARPALRPRWSIAGWFRTADHLPTDRAHAPLPARAAPR